MNNIWNKFNRKVVLCYTGYKERYESVRSELQRIGMGDVEFRFDFPSPLKDILKDHINTTNFTKNIGPFSCVIAHYSVIKQTFELGYDNLLIMEDDIRFLRDLDRISAIVETLPPDYDYAQFEKAKPYEMPMSEWLALKNGPHVNKYWLPFTNLRGGGCYALSRKGMKHMIDEFERAFTSKSEKLRSNDYLVSKGHHLKRYFCFPSIAAQMVFSVSNSDIAEYWRRNELDGLPFADYHTEGTLYPIATDEDFIKGIDIAIARKIQTEENHSYKRIYNAWSNKAMLPFVFHDCEHTTTGRVDAAIVWGYNTSELNKKAMSTAIRDNACVLFCEPGFISSTTTWADKRSNSRYRIEHSVMVDRGGQFFDGTKRTDIERMLDDKNLIISKEERDEARRLIKKIVENKISKYNHQPIFTPSIGRKDVRKVLVVDQSYGDFSIKRGLADDSTFSKMLEAAINENPDADILVKTHPDTIAGKSSVKKGYYQDLKEHDNIYRVTFPINPYSLLEICDKVYVCSSQFGLEALMAGKEVHIFGMPFYAGWGLTTDYQHLDRRRNTRSLEELFYIFYCKYTHWVDPEKGCETTIDAIIDKMIELREEFRANPYKVGTMSSPPKVDNGKNGYRLGSKANQPPPPPKETIVTGLIKTRGFWAMPTKGWF